MKTNGLSFSEAVKALEYGKCTGFKRPGGTIVVYDPVTDSLVWDRGGYISWSSSFRPSLDYYSRTDFELVGVKSEEYKGVFRRYAFCDNYVVADVAGVPSDMIGKKCKIIVVEDEK